MPLHPTFTHGFSDENRDITRQLTQMVTAVSRRNDVHCTYSPIDATKEHEAGVVLRVCVITDEKRFQLQEVTSSLFPVGVEIDLTPVALHAQKQLVHIPMSPENTARA